MKQNGILVFLVFIVPLSFAQGKVTYNIEQRIETIEQQYINAWKKIKKIDGFRIQITSFSGVNSKTQIANTEAQFKQQFPDIPCYITFFEPDFRLRAGNYRTKLEAYKALQKIAPLFEGAFVLKDQIEYK